jgi:hypothetical protein
MNAPRIRVRRQEPSHASITSIPFLAHAIQDIRVYYARPISMNAHPIRAVPSAH